MSWHNWLIVGYLTSCTVGYGVIHYDVHIHEKGCYLCNRYGTFCGCGHSFLDIKARIEKLIAWAEKNPWFISLTDATRKESLLTNELLGLMLVSFILILPLLATAVAIVSHVLNPLHRRKCLADVLNPPAETNV